MPLSDFINRHKGETAYLFGKGKSFASYDFKDAGKLRCAINDVLDHVPDCIYGFSNDGVSAWKDIYKKNQTIFQPVRCLGEYDSTKPGAVACNVVTYEDCYDDEKMTLPIEQHAELLAVRRGTLGSALQILRIMGVKTVHLIGFDGGNHHADGYVWKTRLRNNHGKDYDEIKHAAIQSADLMGLTLKFHNQQGDIMDNNGKIWVKFIRDAGAQGEHHSRGSIYLFPPKIARELVESRAAAFFTPPTRDELPQVETAVAPMQARETAVIETKKRGRKPSK